MCLMFFVKYLLFFVNFAFWLAGVALIGIGLAVIINVNAIVELLPVDPSGIPIAVIVAGCVIFVIAFAGCYGALREARCWLILYAVFMLVLAAAKSYLAYEVFSQLDTLPATVESWVNEAFMEHEVVSSNFQIFETTFQCCGSSGPASYTALGLPIPLTCCPEPENGVCSAETSYKGCAARLGDYLNRYGEIVGAIIIAIIVVEVIAMIAALYMNHKITKNLQRSKTY